MAELLLFTYLSYRSELERLSGQTFSINIIIRFKIVNEVQMALWPIFTLIYTRYTLAKLWLSYD